MINQKQKILDRMRERGAISAREIFDICRCNSPRKRISELRALGYKIEDRWRCNEDGKRWKEYYLREEKKA